MSDSQAAIGTIMVCGVIFAPLWGALFAWLYGYSDRRNRRADLQ